jgi:hypothetical protein
MSSRAVKRLLWIVNHQTLMAAEVPILRSLGWEVFVPKLVPNDVSYRSAGVSHAFDEALSLPGTALGVLNRQNFYQHPWSPTVEAIINEHFSLVVTTISHYTMALSEAARNFDGTVVARIFGREHPRRYSEWPETTRRPALLSELSAIGDRFVFAQSYDNLAEIEDEPFRSRAHTVTVPLAPSIYERAGAWRGDAADAIFLCPAINDTGYYAGIYREIKRLFGDLPHRIFGRQFGAVTDPAVLPFLTDADLFDLYAGAPVFVYPSAEPRHLHYSPIEAMVVGTPVVYREGSLLDRIAGERLPGACADDAELRELTERLLAGDRDLAERIRAAQGPIVEAFSADLARSQWQALLAGVAA